MDIGRLTTTTKVRVLIMMVHYYREMWKRWSHLLVPLEEASTSSTGREILWNDDMEVNF